MFEELFSVKLADQFMQIVTSRAASADVEKDLAGTIEQAFSAVENASGASLAGTDLLLAGPYAALSSGIISSGYYGKAYVGGVPCHHLAFRTAKVDWQIWVKDGAEPLPMKYVITTKWTTGAPQYSVQFGDWNLKPVISGDRFTFVVPQGAQKLETLPVDDAGELMVQKEAK